MAYKIYTKKLIAYERQRRSARRQRRHEKRIGLAVSDLLHHVEEGIQAAAQQDPNRACLLGGDVVETFSRFTDHLNDLVAQDERDQTQEATAFLRAINFWPSVGLDLASLFLQTLLQDACDQSDHSAV